MIDMNVYDESATDLIVWFKWSPLKFNDQFPTKRTQSQNILLC